MTLADLTPVEELAQVLPADLAKAFCDHRKALKKPMTGYAARLMAKKLREMPDPVAAAERSILKGWADVFPPPSNSGPYFGGPNNGAETIIQRRRRELAERISNGQGSGSEGSGDLGAPRRLSQFQGDR
jgi:hypothetical protein